MCRALAPDGDGLAGPGHYVTTLSFTLEPGLGETDERQYPLEDVLDVELCTQGWRDKMEALVAITGRHVDDKRVVEDDGARVLLVIE